MLIEKTEFADLLIITPKVIGDARGSFSEVFREDLLSMALGYIPHFVQDNESASSEGVFRGLHFQIPPYGMAKLVRVSRGKVLDIVLDLRKTEPTYGRCFKIELSAENKKQLFIPQGFAHGFLSLEEGSLFTYKCSNYYSREHDRTLLWSDPTFDIRLPHKAPLVSDKDAAGMPWSAFDSPF